MDKLEMAIELIKEAQRERDNIKNYNTKMKMAESWDEMRAIWDFYDHIPKKSIVNDNLKMARRLLADEYIKYGEA